MLSMLILSRYAKQAISIIAPSGEVVEVVVVDAHKGRVRLGVTGKQNTVIVRNELLEVKNGALKLREIGDNFGDPGLHHFTTCDPSKQKEQ